MRLTHIAVACCLWTLPLQAEEKVESLMQALQVDEIISVLRDEGNAMGQEMQETILNNSGGPVFLAEVDRIYSADTMREHIELVFEESLSDSQLDRAILFFEGEVGKTIVSLEISARVALSDETIEKMAEEAYRTGDRDSRLFKLVSEYIEANNLVEENVQNAISADYNFFRGLNLEVGGDDADLLAQLLAQKDSMTEETTTWLYSFFLLAYQPLSDAQMRENIAFSRTETGRAINDALFESFDRMYDSIYFQLGQAVAQVLNGSDL